MNALIAIANTFTVKPLNKMRSVAAAIAIAAAVTLITRTGMTATEDQVSWFAAFWIDIRFFTIWTNLLVGGVSGAIALGYNVPHWLSAGTALSIGLVAGVYHALLAAGRALVGLDWVIDGMLHTVVPLAFIVLWIFALPKADLRWGNLLIWSAYPTLYSAYAIVRGAIDGTYPYFFLNPAELGFVGVAAWVGTLALVFVGAGALIISGARWALSRA